MYKFGIHQYKTMCKCCHNRCVKLCKKIAAKQIAKQMTSPIESYDYVAL